MDKYKEMLRKRDANCNVNPNSRALIFEHMANNCTPAFNLPPESSCYNCVSGSVSAQSIAIAYIERLCGTMHANLSKLAICEYSRTNFVSNDVLCRLQVYIIMVSQVGRQAAR